MSNLEQLISEDAVVGMEASSSAVLHDTTLLHITEHGQGKSGTFDAARG